LSYNLKALEAAIRLPAVLSVLRGEGKTPVARIGRFAIFWQSQSDFYDKPLPEPSEIIVRGILDTYGLSESSDRPDLSIASSRPPITACRPSWSSAENQARDPPFPISRSRSPPTRYRTRTVARQPGDGKDISCGFRRVGYDALPARQESPMSPSLFDAVAPRPLAERIRPSTLAEVVGQEHLLGPDGPIGRMVRAKRLSSLILWGPPGVGKTTIARLLAREVNLEFEQISAVVYGIPELRKILEAAKQRRSSAGRSTLLLVDEIHAWRRPQQDALLPHVEDGTIVLVGATTENVSFEIAGALLSRAQVMRLEALGPDSMEAILMRAEREIGRRLPLDADARTMLLAMAQGDGRVLAGLAEQISHLDPAVSIVADELPRLVQRRAVSHDKRGDGHYGLISALQKSIRGSDPDSGLYWLARLLKGGEPPRGILRRLAVMATEEVGLADPAAVQQVDACAALFERLGEPEGLPAVGQAVAYLATAVKSNATYAAFYAAMELADATGDLPVPMHLVNAPTEMMRQMGFKDGYVWDHECEHAFSGQDFMPEGLDGDARPHLYVPNERGNEREIIKRMRFWEELRRKRRGA
jgi:putative ATPase